MRFSIRIKNRELPLSRIETIYQRAANADSDKRRLATEVGEEPEKQAQADTEEQAGDDRKVKCGVLAAVDNVAGQAAEAEGELGTEIENRAEEDQESAEEKKCAAEFTKGVHAGDCSDRRGSSEAGSQGGR